MKLFKLLMLLIWIFGILTIEAREVIGWIAPYHTEEGKAALRMDCGQYSPKDGISAIAIQFWIPTFEGGLQLATEEGATEEEVQDFKRIADSLGIKVLLCIYNYTKLSI